MAGTSRIWMPAMVRPSREPTRQRLAWLLSLATLAVACAVSGIVLARVGTGAAPPSPHEALSPGFPLASVEGTEAQLLGHTGRRSYFVAPGKGPTAGMVCFVTATADVAHTGCDPREVVDTRGVLLSEEMPGDRLVVFGYVPAGFTRAQAGLVGAPVINRVVSLVVARLESHLVLTGSGGSLTLDIPGAEGMP